jgi:histone H3/H4
MKTIRYDHTSDETAETMERALQMVAAELCRTAGTKCGADDMVTVKCDDGVYIYRDAEERDADDTGIAAFAVIS